MIEPKEDDIYIAYLPLAHVLELMSENTMMLFGIKVMWHIFFACTFTKTLNKS